MDNPFQIFSHPDFGKVRVVIIDGVLYFVGKDVATALGYKKPENAIAMHVDDEDKTTTLIQGTGSNYKSKAVVINESGLYALTFASKLEKAKEFRRWVTNEVLPSIRQTGSYSLDAKTTQLIPAATVDKSAARRAAQLKPAHVYVALLKNKTGEFVKIGISSEPLKRIKAVNKQNESITCDFNITSLMPREVSRFIEGLCKEKFSSRRIEGEFFSVDFAEMFDAVKMFTKTVLGKTFDEEEFAKLKSQVKLLMEPAEDFAEIIYRGDLLAGENIFCMAIE